MGQTNWFRRGPVNAVLSCWNELRPKNSSLSKFRLNLKLFTYKQKFEEKYIIRKKKKKKNHNIKEKLIRINYKDSKYIIYVYIKTLDRRNTNQVEAVYLNKFFFIFKMLNIIVKYQKQQKQKWVIIELWDIRF